MRFECQLLLAFLILSLPLSGQVSPDCSSAVPICSNTPVNGGTLSYGVDDFNGAHSSGCLEVSTSGVIESNSAWYRFRTAASGQLGINIGHDSSEDWDFALYLADDCNTLGDPIRCNFFDNRDQNTFIGIGMDPSGDTANVQYEDWIQVEPGQDYFLFINNFSNNNSGFSIQFSGDVFTTNPTDALDCSIVSNLLGPPIAACENETVILDATTPNASSYAWYEDLGMGFNEILGANNATLQVLQDAFYRVRVITPTESIISDVQVAFNQVPVTQAVQDIIYCFDDSNSIFDLSAIDATARGPLAPQEFTVSYHSSQVDADLGLNPLPKEYQKTLGDETIFIRTTSVQNPKCYDSFQSFRLNALGVNISNIASEVSICENAASITIGEENPNPNFSYEWSTGELTPTIAVAGPGSYSLTVTNSHGMATCSQTQVINVLESLSPRIGSVQVNDLQSDNSVTIIPEFDGNYEFRLDDGRFQSSNRFNGVFPGEHTVTIIDLEGCGSITEPIVVMGFSNHFSPNGDGANENWQVEGLSAVNQPILSIYDRYGKLLAQLNDLNQSWDGLFNGQLLPASDYWFKLTYVNNTGNRVEAKYIQNHFSLRR
ncbi:T9SS type B sorting domain-containing protein [Croceivirga thetidis]|uniref:T9SS type B sorting domain-containing protein n=1 Tax=Croceivirga thetidis TaxID=2721623 RepID=A0ABX1GTZ0_9FLAO|nr:T9SS type B sorting domain-containing protein [Croceivirga thetidis]NKI33089.1 T9SS type B sorting domain-containing protein [Croceivirga thetidis]